MRLFLAINLPDDERRGIRAATAPMREAARGITWVAEDKLHLTLKFFGEQPEEIGASLADALRPVAHAHALPELRLGGLGAFPNLRAPRIVWLGVEAEPRLELLHHELERACEALGFEVDGRAFRPHVTLGRVRDRLDGGAARALAERARAVRYRGVAPVDTVDLMASQLGPGGPRYTLVAALPLARG